MAALYDLFRTPQPKGEEKVRYHARSVVTGKMTTRDLVHAIAQRSAFKEGVVTGVLIGLEEAIREALAEGKSVQLDGIGAFRITKSEAYKRFLRMNDQWVVAYRVFCHRRDQENTSYFPMWKTLSEYDEKQMRDYAFAKHFGLEIRPLIEGCDVSEESFDAKEGSLLITLKV